MVTYKLNVFPVLGSLAMTDWSEAKHQLLNRSELEVGDEPSSLDGESHSSELTILPNKDLLKGILRIAGKN